VTISASFCGHSCLSKWSNRTTLVARSFRGGSSYNGAPFSTSQNAITAWIATTQRPYSASTVTSSIIITVSISNMCCSIIYPICYKAPITSSSTTFPESCRLLLITSCSFLYRSRFSHTRRFYYYCFSFRSARRAF
jgi:hypothetical protein